MCVDFIKKNYCNVDYYNKKLGKTIINWADGIEKILHKIPLLEKDELVTDSLKIMPYEYVSGLYMKNYIETFTSGSTGKCLKIYWKKEDYIKSMLSLWLYRKHYYGIEVVDRSCQFFNISQIGGSERETIREGNKLLFCKNNLNDFRLKDIYREMLDFQPKWLYLQPCIAELLYIIKRKYNLPEIESLYYIELTGEMCDSNLKNKLKQEFKCRVANQYGANEVNSIAYECPEGTLHIMENNVLVEILDEDGNILGDDKEGNIYITTKHNNVMPFIRYGIGDVGSIGQKICNCGNKAKALNLRAGRKNDWIFLDNGDKVNAYVFVRAIDVINILLEDCIIQYQIIQIDINSFEVKLVLDEEVNETILEEYFIANIGQEELKKANYRFVFYDKLIPEINGKKSFFKSLLKNERSKY